MQTDNADRQTDRQTNVRGQTHLPPTLSEVIIKDSARVILLRLTIDEHKTSRGLSATAQLLVERSVHE